MPYPLDAFFNRCSRDHYLMSTACAFQSEISPYSQHLPLKTTTRMFLLKFYNIFNINFHTNSIPQTLCVYHFKIWLKNPDLSAVPQPYKHIIILLYSEFLYNCTKFFRCSLEFSCLILYPSGVLCHCLGILCHCGSSFRTLCGRIFQFLKCSYYTCHFR